VAASFGSSFGGIATPRDEDTLKVQFCVVKDRMSIFKWVTSKSHKVSETIFTYPNLSLKEDV